MVAAYLVLLRIAAIFITSISRGHLARLRAAERRMQRDATIVIAKYCRGWRLRRRRRLALQRGQQWSTEANLLPPEKASDVLIRRMATHRLHVARMRAEQQTSAKPSAAGELMPTELRRGRTSTYVSGEVDADAMLLVSFYVKRWLGRRAVTEATARRKAADARAAAAAAAAAEAEAEAAFAAKEEKQLRFESMQLSVTKFDRQELNRAKERIQERISERRTMRRRASLPARLNSGPLAVLV